MKLAEALARRHDLMTEIEQLQDVMQGSARWQEGSEPADNATEILDAIIALRQEAGSLIVRINLTNVRTVVPDSADTIMMLLAKRDATQEMVKYCQSLLTAAGAGRRGALFRQLRTELPDVTNVDVLAIRDRMRGYAAAARGIDSTIQKLNWETDLLTEA